MSKKDILKISQQETCAECGVGGGHALYCVACAEKYVSKGTRMTREEYIKLFHKEQLNLVAFKRLMDCDEEVLRLVNSAIKTEREACAKIAEEPWQGSPKGIAELIRARK